MDEQSSPFADRPQPTEEELRAYEQQLRAYEEQLKQIRVEDVLVQTVVSLINLGARKGGLAPSDPAAPEADAQADPEQLRLAIEGARALMPLLEDAVGATGEAAGDLKQLRDALSQLQLAYASLAGGSASAPNQPTDQQSQGPGPAQASGRLWVPGQ